MSTLYQIKIQLLGANNPEIWRRVIVPSDATYENLHYIIQRAMGWENEHLFIFTDNEDYPIGWEISTEEGLKKPFGFYTRKASLVAKETAIEEFLNPSHTTIKYTYDFGDGWEHLLTLENADVKDIVDNDRAHCIDGSGCCPPEDCGGTYSYMEIVEAVKENPEKAIKILNDDDYDDYDAEDEIDDEFEEGSDAYSDDYEDEESDSDDEEYDEEEDDSFDDEEEYDLDDEDVKDGDGDDEFDTEEVLEWVRGVGTFFAMVDGKPDFSKIDLEGIERNVSNIELRKIYPYRQKGLSKYQAAMRKLY